MSFQAYLENIHAKTGNTPEQLKALATTAGVYKSDMKAGDLVAWLKNEFDLGHGHSMAIWKYFTVKGWVKPPKNAGVTSNGVVTALVRGKTVTK